MIYFSKLITFLGINYLGFEGIDEMNSIDKI